MRIGVGAVCALRAVCVHAVCECRVCAPHVLRVSE
jgi:hypothetical protein